MDTDRLRYFIVIAETGSLSKASQILGISHSGLSKAVSSLEAEVKLKLFRPQGRGLEITLDGKWFYQKSKEILKITNEVLSKQPTTNSMVRIGLSGVIANTCAGVIATEFQEPLLLQEIDFGELEGKIISNELDFGVAFTPSPQPELEYLELGTVKFESFVRQDLYERVSFEKIPFTVPISDAPLNPLSYRNRDGWPDDVFRRSYFAVSGFSMALDLLRSGQSAIYMPSFVAAQENAKSAQKIIPVEEHKAARTTRKLFLVKRQSVEESKAMKKIAKMIRKICCSQK